MSDGEVVKATVENGAPSMMLHPALPIPISFTRRGEPLSDLDKRTIDAGIPARL